MRRHGRAIVVTVHGWNVVQPAVDIGLGCSPGEHPLGVSASAAVSQDFATGTVGALLAACAARGIAATVGARYPARARENLVQLFTTRHQRDRRPLVSRLAALASRCDALQLELSIPLRWPGPWRQRLVEAFLAALPRSGDGAPAVLAPGAAAAAPTPAAAAAARRPGPPALARAATAVAGARGALEFVADGMCGLVALDRTGGRLLLFPPGGELVMFTAERVASSAGDVAGLALERSAGGLRVTFRGPLVRFPDTAPFLDLERGLGTASVVADGAVTLAFDPPHHAGSDGGDFGRVHGVVRLADDEHTVEGHGFAAAAGPPTVWPRVRAALRLGPARGLSLVVGTRDGSVSGFLCDGRHHRAVVAAEVRPTRSDDPLSHLELAVRLEDGELLSITARAARRLPVVRGGHPAVRLLYASCTVDGMPGAAGWCELGGI